MRTNKANYDRVRSQLNGMVKQGLLTSYEITPTDDPDVFDISVEGTIYAPKKDVVFISISDL